MLDGGTFRLYFACLDILLHDKKFKFKKSEEDCYSCIYKGLHLKLIYNAGCCVVHGSIHKFKNHGKTNKDMFTICQLITTLKELYKELYMDKCTKIEFSSIEFGVNIKLGYNPNLFIDYILKIEGWKFMEGGIRFESKGNYEFKIYYITEKYPIPVGSSSVKYKKRYVMRFELKIKKMEKFDQIMSAGYFPKINKFSDFIDLDVLRILKNYLLEEFDNLMVWDRELIDESLFKGKKRELFMNGCYTTYWDNFVLREVELGSKKDSAVKKKYNQMKNFIKLLDDNSSMKKDIRILIIESLDKIFDATETDIKDFRLWMKDKPDIYPLKLDEDTKKRINEKRNKTKMSDSAPLENKEPKKRKRNNRPDIKVPVYKTSTTKDIFGNETTELTSEIRRIGDFVRISALYCLDKGAESDKNRYCPVTKLKKCLNDPRSKFLSSKEVEYYYHNYRAIYYRELYRRLPSQWYSAPLKKQFKEIAHAIRNEDSNPRNNEKNRLDKKKNPEQMSLDF